MSNGHGPDRDPAEFNTLRGEAFYEFDPAAELDRFEDACAHIFETVRDDAERQRQIMLVQREMFDPDVPVLVARLGLVRFREVVGELVRVLNARTLQRKLVALAIAAGLAEYAHHTETQWAKKLGCTRAAISKEVVHWRDLLCLPPTGYLKSDHARRVYSNRQRTVAAR